VKIVILGGGPGGLYSAILIKKAYPRWDITVIERNPPDATYGYGVVFSDRTLTSFREADYPSYKAVTDEFAIWDPIDVRYAGQSIRCAGNVFAGISRKVLLMLLQKRCRELGVEMEFFREVSDVEQLGTYDLLIAADGINSIVRRTFPEAFEPSLVPGKAKYIWLGTRKVFDAFTFSFRENEHGLFQGHIYPNDGEASTIVILCDQESWRRAGLDRTTEAESVSYCEQVFAEDLGGQPLLANKSDWITFQTVRNNRWRHGNIVLLGDAAHTADFTIGSGTKLAMEDAIALARAFERYGEDVDRALTDYELERRPAVEGLQKAALESSQYFENIKRYTHFEPMQFAYYLLTRSGRISYDELRRRDSPLVDAVDRWFYEKTTEADDPNARAIAPPPMLAPLRLRDLGLPNRVVVAASPTYTAIDGRPGEDYEAQLVALARSRAALVVTEPIAVSADGRITPRCAGLYRREHAAAWSRIVARVHGEAGTKIALRLGHAGRRGATRPRSDGVDRPLGEGGWSLLSPSPIPYGPGNAIPRQMDRADMDRVRDAFVRAAEMAREAGADAIELHFAHGYLLASFLSPLANRRDDAYGGSLANRLRFPLEVFEAVRAVWPEERPIAVAVPATDWARGGLDVEDAVVIAEALKARGCDLIEVLAGQTTAQAGGVYGRGYLTSFSDQIRNEVHVPTLVGGYLTTTDEVNNILAGGRGDLCILEQPALNARHREIPAGAALRAASARSRNGASSAPEVEVVEARMRRSN